MKVRQGDYKMSEFINNVSRDRQNRLKSFIFRLHNGEDKDIVEAEFKKEFAYVTGAEIAQMEFNLVQEGVSVEEIQNLCDVHASLFQGSVQDLHSDELTINPLTSFEEENQKLADILDEAMLINDARDEKTLRVQMLAFLDELDFLEKHYAKKENILFPYLEKSGDFVISKVMWGVDNKIRKALKKAKKQVSEAKNIKAEIKTFKESMSQARDMVTKEDRVLFPMLREKLSADQFKEIAISLGDISLTEYQAETIDKNIDPDVIAMTMGALNTTEINAIFNTIPVDMTFVGADNTVKWVSQGKERIFDRPFSVIGRPIDLCHPPQSVDIVMKIVEDLRSGRKDNEDFWINFKGQFVYIRYFAVRDEKGTFLGTLEVTQAINEIRSLEGEKRLASL